MLRFADCKAGSRMEISKAMIEMTTKSSMVAITPASASSFGVYFVKPECDKSFGRASMPDF